MNDKQPITGRPGESLPPTDLAKIQAKVVAELKLGEEDKEDESRDDEDLHGYLMYPKVLFELYGQLGKCQCRTGRPRPRSRFDRRPTVSMLPTSRPAMPGLVIGVVAAPGKTLAKGDTVLHLEAMKMHTVLTAECAGTVESIHVESGDQVEAKDLVAK